MPIQQCRVIDFPFLRSINYPYFKIKTFGWTKILSLNVLVRESLVHAFFSIASLIVNDHDNVIAISWEDFGDCSKLEPNREAYKIHYMQT